MSTPDGIADALIIHMDWKRFCLDSIESNLFFLWNEQTDGLERQEAVKVGLYWRQFVVLNQDIVK